MYFQDGGHDVCPLLAASAGCPLSHRARMTTLDRSVFWETFAQFACSLLIALTISNAP